MTSEIPAPHARQRRIASRWRGRLRANALLITAALAAIAILAVAGDRHVLGAVLAIAVAVAALTGSRRSPSAGSPTSGPDLPALPEHPTAIDLAAAIADPLIVCDSHGVVLFANGAASAAFGSLLPGDLITLRFRSPEMQDLVAAAIEGGAPAPIEHAERVPMERSYRVSVTRIAEDGRFAFFFRDQSETRRIDRMRADFIANASHELRTPLASVSGFIETLRGPAKNDVEARERFLQIMQTQTARMARLIDDLLSLSRLEMKPLAGAGTSVDLVRLVREVSDSLGQLIRENDMSLRLDVPATPVLVAANADEIVQVVENLIENACKYGQSGERIDLTVRPAVNGSGEAEITVRDYGPGIPAEHIPRVTERFYRVDVETSRAQKGTGLGLAIVKHILTRHRGRLTIKSEPGQGAAFTVHLPVPGRPS